jgi:galactoside O-acetyltransferase
MRFGLRGKFKRISTRVYSKYVGSQLGSCGQGLLVAYPLTITGPEYISIGDKVVIMRNSYLYANDGCLTIGNNVSINTNVQLGASQGEIHIGNNVLIGPNVVLRAADHGQAMGTSPRYQPHQRGQIFIEDDVWIAANVVVTRNVKLGRGCIVAAGSVVTKEVLPFHIVAGVPAAVIGTRQ